MVALTMFHFPNYDPFMDWMSRGISMVALTMFHFPNYDPFMDWRDKAKILIKQSGKAQYWFAEKLGLEPYELSRYLSKRKGRRMPVELMLDLAKELEVHPGIFFSEDETEDLLFGAIRGLDKDQRHLAIRFFDSIKKSSREANS